MTEHKEGAVATGAGAHDQVLQMIWDEVKSIRQAQSNGLSRVYEKLDTMKDEHALAQKEVRSEIGAIKEQLTTHKLKLAGIVSFLALAISTVGSYLTKKFWEF